MIPYIIYILIVILLSYKGEKSRISRFLLFITAVLFMGLRLGVGKDYDNYKDYYDYESYIFEPGYNYLCLFAHQHHLGVQFVFFIMALLTYFFIYLFLERIKEFEIKYAPAAIMLYFLTFSIVCNVMRECLAASIFLYSCYYIKDNKLLHYLALIAFATLFHYSILICIPLYWILKRKIATKYYVIIYIVSFSLCFIQMEQLVSYFIPFFEDYKRWMMYMDSDKYSTAYFSLGILLEIMFYASIFIICVKNKIDERNTLLFNLIFISCIVMNMKVGSPLMTRVGMLFSWFTYVAIPLMIKYEPNSQNRYLWIRAYIIYFIVTFIQYAVFDKNSYLYPYKSVLSSINLL